MGRVVDRGKGREEEGRKQDVREEVILQALGVRKESPDEVAFAVSPPFAWVSAEAGLIQKWWTTPAVVAGWHCCGWKKLPRVQMMSDGAWDGVERGGKRGSV